ncbi:Cilia- and flagella-associated protein 57, partial [Orchesella cincta]
LLCTYDEIFCVSTAADNSICFWKMTDAEGRVAKLEKDLNYATEILVTKQDLEERQVAINELQQRYGELKLEMDYALKRKDMLYQEELKDLNGKFTNEVARLTSDIAEITKEKEKNTAEYNAYLKEVAQQHKAQIENTEAHFNTKLISEFEKYNALQNLLESTIQEYEDRLIKLEADRSNAIEELIDYFEGKIKDKNSALEQAFNDAQAQMAESDEMKRQIEEDADQEILEMTTNYERKLRHEREMNAKLKGESGIMRKKFQTMQKDIEEQKNEVQRLMTECAKYNNLIKMTEKDVVTLQKALVDKDLAVANKDKHIAELMKTNSDLEKFKFVLEYRIRELRKLLEPKDREIIYLKQQNADMETELESTIFVRNGLQLQVSELKNKLRMTDSERNKEKRLRMRSLVLVERMRNYLTRAMSVVADHRALKHVVKSMYTKYGNATKADKAGSAEQEAICELVRQRNHLEISLTSVKRKLSKDAQFTRSEQLKIMHENLLLVYEINNLRRELKNARDKLNQYETSLGLNQASHATEAAEMRYKLQTAIEDRDDIDIAHENVLEMKDNMIQAQQEEIDTLSTKILKVHEYILDTARPTTGMPGPAVDHIKSVLSSNAFQKISE